MQVGSGNLALAQHGMNAGDIPLGRSHLCGVVKLPGSERKAQVEQFLAGAVQFVEQLIIRQGSKRQGLRHQIASSREITRARMGSF